MNEKEALQIFGEVGALLDGHFVYDSGLHGFRYMNKDAVYPRVRLTSVLCLDIARHFSDEKVFGIDVVAAPAIGGVILCTWTAHWLGKLTEREALSVYAEKDNLQFVFKRGYDKLLAGRRVLVVEDVLTTGGSARGVVEAVRTCGGKVVGVGVLCNRGGVTLEGVANPPELFALLNVVFEAWPAAECPLCARGVPINTDVGKGREFLAKKKL